MFQNVYVLINVRKKIICCWDVLLDVLNGDKY